MSREICLTKGLSTIIDDDDYDWISGMEWYTQVDSRGKMYAATSIMGDIVYLHRLITDADDDMVVDHQNGDTLDNRRDNLIVSSTQENSMNKAKTKHHRSSQYKGVTKMKNGRWKAHIGVDDRDIHLGYFKTEEEAARAYDKAARDEFGERARLNFPEE